MPEKKSMKNDEHFSEIDMFEMISCRHAFGKYTSFVHVINVFQFTRIYCNIMINPRELYLYDCESEREKMLSSLKINFCSMRYPNSAVSIEEIAVIEKREKVVKK